MKFFSLMSGWQRHRGPNSSYKIYAEHFKLAPSYVRDII